MLVSVTIRTAVVPLAEVYELRWSVLRPGLPRESAAFSEDDDPATFHMAAYADGSPTVPTVVACITVFPDPLPGTSTRTSTSTSTTAYRFRGMASAPEARGRGYGAAVLRAATTEAASRGAGLLWCNGRSEAIGFYKSQGYAVVGEEFVIEGVGPHYRLIRTIP
jgi:GNAT superfamily N-acetyltransferase